MTLKLFPSFGKFKTLPYCVNVFIFYFKREYHTVQTTNIALQHNRHLQVGIKVKIKICVNFNNNKIGLNLPISKIFGAGLLLELTAKHACEVEAEVSSVLTISTNKQYSVSKTAHV